VREKEQAVFFICLFSIWTIIMTVDITMTLIIDLGTFNKRKTSCHSGSQINWTLTLPILADTEISTQMETNLKRERLTN